MHISVYGAARTYCQPTGPQTADRFRACGLTEMCVEKPQDAGCLSFYAAGDRPGMCFASNVGRCLARIVNAIPEYYRICWTREALLRALLLGALVIGPQIPVGMYSG